MEASLRGQVVQGANAMGEYGITLMGFLLIIGSHGSARLTKNSLIGLYVRIFIGLTTNTQQWFDGAHHDTTITATIITPAAIIAVVRSWRRRGALAAMPG